MGLSVFPAPSAASLTKKVDTLNSGSTYTVPAGVTSLIVTCIGGGGGGTSFNAATPNAPNIGYGGQVVTSTVATSPGASISYTLGAGGTGGQPGSAGGTTSFTGATSASGGNGTKIYENSVPNPAQRGLVSYNGGQSQGTASGSPAGGTGGAGQIIVEYWS
jgi:hypothetical protein